MGFAGEIPCLDNNIFLSPFIVFFLLGNFRLFRIITKTANSFQKMLYGSCIKENGSGFCFMDCCFVCTIGVFSFILEESETPIEAAAYHNFEIYSKSSLSGTARTFFYDPMKERILLCLWDMSIVLEKNRGSLRFF
jgi:hypothetical protein